jgi:hypothetical protein
MKAAMIKRNQFAFALVLISFGLLYLGLTLPVLTITVSSKVTSAMGGLEGEVLNKTRSVIGTVKDLYDDGKLLVAGLILFFGIVVPVTKGLLLLLSLLNNGSRFACGAVGLVKRIGKWSMADVFVVAILLAYLATSYQEDSIRESLSILGAKVTVDLSTQMLSRLQPGFYWFLSYCLVSLLPLELAQIEKPSA